MTHAEAVLVGVAFGVALIPVLIWLVERD